MTRTEAENIIREVPDGVFLDALDDWEGGVSEDDFRGHYYTRPLMREAIRVLYPREMRRPVKSSGLWISEKEESPSVLLQLQCQKSQKNSGTGNV